jgi:hypothetical protein
LGIPTQKALFFHEKSVSRLPCGGHILAEGEFVSGFVGLGQIACPFFLGDKEEANGVKVQSEGENEAV